MNRLRRLLCKLGLHSYEHLGTTTWIQYEEEFLRCRRCGNRVTWVYGPGGPFKKESKRPNNV